MESKIIRLFQENFVFINFIDGIKSRDNNYIIIGEISSSGIVLKITPEGDLLWQKRIFSHTHNIYLNRIRAIFGDGPAYQDFVVLGNQQSQGAENKPFFFRISSEGVIAWKKILTLGLNSLKGDLVPLSLSTLGISFYFSFPFQGYTILGALHHSGNLVLLKKIITPNEDSYLEGLDQNNGVILFGKNSFININPSPFGLRAAFSLKRIDEPLPIFFFKRSSVPEVETYFLGFDGSERRHYLLPFRLNDWDNNSDGLDIFSFATNSYSGSKENVDLFKDGTIDDNSLSFFYTNHYYPSSGEHRAFLLKFLIGADGEVDYTPAWSKQLNLNLFLKKILFIPGLGEKILIGTKQNESGTSGVFGKTNKEYDSCVTESISPIENFNTKVYKHPLEVTIENLALPSFESFDFLEENLDLQKEFICPIPFILEADHILQSPYISLLSAGSIGEDSTAGIHLRWMLLRNLGDSHLPKGNYATSNANFNKPQDYIKVYRIPYSSNYQELNLESQWPININNILRKWVYEIQTNDDELITIHFQFLNSEAYSNTLNLIDPNSTPFEFITAYGEKLIHVEFVNQSCFACELEINENEDNTFVKVESFSTIPNISGSEQFLSSRTSILNQTPIRIVSENIQSVRFQVIGGSLHTIRLERYKDFLHYSMEQNAIENIGKFALTLDDDKAFKNLEDAERNINLNQQWKRFNEVDMVNTNNYKKKWNNPVNQQNGIKFGVEQYLELSNNGTNPTALATLPADINPDSENIYPDMEGSFLDMLNLVATDFHIARMLGLGYIDIPPGNEEIPYIYLLEYNTLGELDDGGGARPVQHLVLSIPTRKVDERLPTKIQVDELKYGLTVQENTNTPIQITDENGYLPNGAARYISLYASLKFDYDTYNNFYQPAIIFNLSEFTYPVFLGVEYWKNGEAVRRPEIANDPNYLGADGIAETLPIPFHEEENKPVFIHREEEEGVHFYAPYPINIFSRASRYSSTIYTDYTKFTKPNTLLPPVNFRTQLIQFEYPLILTSQNEQALLEAIAGTDKTLVRVTFNYNHIHDMNYNYGDEIEFFFRKEMPPNIAGKVNSIEADGTKIGTEPYLYSSNPELTDEPAILASNRPAFIGGFLSIGEEKFEVEDITYDGTTEEAPNIIVKKRGERDVIIQDNGQPFITQEFITPISTNIGERFTMISNMRNPESWGESNPLALTVKINTDQWSEQSDIINSQEFLIRGIWEEAQILSEEEGYYIIQFSSFILANHPQENINWAGGTVRVPYPDSEERIELEVLKIQRVDNTGNEIPTILHAIISSEENALSFELETNLLVNFYPGYKVYLYAQGQLNESNILPVYGERYRNTLIGARTKDTDNGYVSDICTPAIIMAPEIIEPVVPKTPTGPDYATPPDWYNKSTYTFDVVFPAIPFQIVFYRSDLSRILDVLPELYLGDDLIAAIDFLTLKDEWFADRWRNFLGEIYSGNEFLSFPPNEENSIPLPNQTSLVEQREDNTIYKKMIEKIISSAFNPILPNPLLFEKDVKLVEHITSSTPAKEIPYTDTTDDFTKVMFTDFTFDGGMITSYFYLVRTIGNTMEMSFPSGIIGPIKLINRNPPEAPTVRKLLSRLADPINSIPPAIVFQIQEYPHYDGIKKMLIYRTLDSSKALSVRLMGNPVAEIDINEPMISDSILTLSDEFIDATEIPYGVPLFYRLVALREVNYNDSDGNPIVEYIPSVPTKVFLSSIIETTNPEAPKITPSYSIVDNNIMDLSLSWNKTTFNGKYYLFIMNSVGNWNKIFNVQTNNPAYLSYTFDDPISKIDDDGDTIYHRFKVSVESTSGLLNLTEEIVTI